MLDLLVMCLDEAAAGPKSSAGGVAEGGVFTPTRWVFLEPQHMQWLDKQ